ncbi:MAG TPA: hypothetical protein DCE44_21140, partial [Verrucomicrobiales bacterium]|nr:hypothetical protein [Verrucomicrobiales bacterium]
MTSSLNTLFAVPIALGVTLLPASAQVLFGGGGSATAQVLPGDPSFDQTPTSGGQSPNPFALAGSASFTGAGLSAGGTAAASYSMAAGFYGVSASATASSSYPSTLPV